MKLLLDLNVLLDVIQRREPFYQASASVLSKVVGGEDSGAIPSHALTTLYYVVQRFSGKEEADGFVVADFEGSPVPVMTPEEFLAYG